jgi:hypothetical protein
MSSIIGLADELAAGTDAGDQAAPPVTITPAARSAPPASQEHHG